MSNSLHQAGRPIVAKKDEQQLDRQIEQLEKELPESVRRTVRWLRAPASRWARIPAGVILILLGLVGFLPVLGFWMAPLGLLLLAHDIPFLRRPARFLLIWIETLLVKWKRWRQGRAADS